MSEPTITVNGEVLSLGQVMTVRVALTSFVDQMRTEGLGEGYQGLTEGYIARGQEVLEMMIQ